MKKLFRTGARIFLTCASALIVSTAVSPATASAHTPVATAADTSMPQNDDAPLHTLESGDGTAQGAIEWYQARIGDTSYEGMCEMAAENAYGTTGVWPSAIAHWEGAKSVGKAHVGDTNPPFGAFVYWNTSVYGHVGIADGNGGFYATSVNGAIGHSSDLFYYGNYLGWSPGQVPQSLK